MNQSICGGFKVTCWAVAAAGAASATLLGAAGNAASKQRMWPKSVCTNLVII